MLGLTLRNFELVAVPDFGRNYKQTVAEVDVTTGFPWQRRTERCKVYEENSNWFYLDDGRAVVPKAVVMRLASAARARYELVEAVSKRVDASEQKADSVVGHQPFHVSIHGGGNGGGGSGVSGTTNPSITHAKLKYLQGIANSFGRV